MATRTDITPAETKSTAAKLVGLVGENPEIAAGSREFEEVRRRVRAKNAELMHLLAEVEDTAASCSDSGAAVSDG